MTEIAYKAQARRLADHLSRVHGIKLKHASLLETVAALHGRPDWNTLLAAGPAAPQVPSTPAGSAAPAAPSASSARPRLMKGSPAAAILPAAQARLLDTYLGQLVTPGTTGMRLVPFGDRFEVHVLRDGVPEHRALGPADEVAALVAALRQGAGLHKDACGAVAEGQFYWRGAGAEWQLQVFLMQGAAPQPWLMVQWFDPAAPVMPLARLGLTGLAEWRRGLSQSQGLCLVAGTTGQGCRTTLEASAQDLREQGREVWDWRQVRADREGRARAGAPPALLVANPGAAVLLGEIRDASAVREVVRLVEQGHLVLASVHASNVPRAIARLVEDLDMPAATLERLLRVALAQKLLRQTCRACADRPALSRTGCAACAGSGYDSLTMVSECIASPCGSVPAPWPDLVRERRTLMDDAVDKCRAGVFDVPELVRVFGAEAGLRLAKPAS